MRRVRARRQTHAAYGQLERAFAGIVQRAEFPQRALRDERVIETAHGLRRAGAIDTFAHLGRRHAVPAAAQLLVRHGGDFNVQVDAVQQRSGNLAEIALDDGARRTALARRIAVITAGTPVQIATATWNANTRLRSEARPKPLAAATRQRGAGVAPCALNHTAGFF
jgi:hypothetical protein